MKNKSSFDKYIMNDGIFNMDLALADGLVIGVDLADGESNSVAVRFEKTKDADENVLWTMTTIENDIE